ncbi:MAG: hypothetical protein R3330_14980, partial [Saprospiraceae bacterium]|nr:hypothetical protein [Saprospiraceae bacterium]
MPTSCFSVANIIPYTVTGNSDQADFKDVILADFPSAITITSCGIIKVVKVTNPSGLVEDFPITIEQLDLGDIDYDMNTSANGTLTGDGSMVLFENLLADTDYQISETPPAPWVIQSMDVDGSPYDHTDPNAVFEVVAGEITVVTITNEYPCPALSAPMVSNSCATALSVPEIADVAGFTREYQFTDPTGNATGWVDYATATAALDAEAGCWLLEFRYNGCPSVSTQAVVFPALSAPTVSNTCNTALSFSPITDVAGFTEEYQVTDPTGNMTGWVDYATATGALDNEVGCWLIEARYVLTAACGSTAAGAISGDAACDPVSINAVVFPGVVDADIDVSDECDAALTLTALADEMGFDEEYQVTPPGGVASGWL